MVVLSCKIQSLDVQRDNSLFDQLPESLISLKMRIHPGINIQRATKLTQMCPNISRLLPVSISYDALQLVASTYQLTHLKIYLHTNLDLKILFHSNLPLRHLDLSGMPITDEDIINIADSYSNTMRSLLLKCCIHFHIQEDSFIYLVRKCNQLEMLDMSAISGVTDKCTQEMSLHLQHLHTLALANCKGLINPIIQMPRLKNLNLRGTVAVDMFPWFKPPQEPIIIQVRTMTGQTSTISAYFKDTFGSILEQLSYNNLSSRRLISPWISMRTRALEDTETLEENSFFEETTLFLLGVSQRG